MFWFVELQQKETTLRNNIIELKKLLRLIIQPDEGLMKCFQNEGVLTSKQADEILVNGDVCEKTDELLRHLIYGYNGECSKILKAFVDCDQKHVAKYIQAGGSE